LSNVASLAASNGHTCALISGGAVTCWGLNTYGQLGDNTTTAHLTPANVSGLTSGVTQITASVQYSCALTSGGGVKCWGGNASGQLGDNSTTTRLTPVNVSGLTSGVIQIAAGGQHTCALTSGGGVKCWGDNSYGQLGDNSTTTRLTPVNVAGLTTGVAKIVAGNYHTCALTAGGGVKCWGGNSYGQVGDNSTTTRLTPVDVSGLASGVTQITTMAYHNCALGSGGGVKCWGDNASGELGDNSTTNRLTPGDVSGLTSGATLISAGNYHTCALTSGGGVKCWGSDDYGQLGDNGTTTQLTPVDVSGLASGMSQIIAGGIHTCGVTSGGGAKCWGANIWGQLGDNSTTNRLTPIDVLP
jgi:alpha-tubulin suppressor-like RCC1 family protein